MKDFKNLLKQGYYEFRLQLGEGIIYSKKTIYYHPETKKYQIFNWIDETDQMLTEKQLFNRKITNIGLGIKRKALIVDLNEKL